MERKLFLFLVFFLGFATLASADMTVQLTYPQGGGATSRMYLPGTPRGIVANGTTTVDFHQIDLYDTVTGDTMTIFPQVEDRNKSTETRLLTSNVIRRGKPGVSSQYPIRQTATYVLATSEYNSNYAPYLATNPNLTLIGSGAGTSWASIAGTYTNQRFHIDLATPKVVTKIYYENWHSSGTSTARGAKNFTFWGSNTDAAFSDTVWISDANMVTEGWTQLTTSQSTFDQHITVDQADPKFITVVNINPFRYYAFKFADVYGQTIFLGVKRIELQTNFTVKYGRKYIMTLRAMDVNGLEATDWGYVYFVPRAIE